MAHPLLSLFPVAQISEPLDHLGNPGSWLHVIWDPTFVYTHSLSHPLETPIQNPGHQGQCHADGRLRVRDELCWSVKDCWAPARWPSLSCGKSGRD